MRNSSALFNGEYTNRWTSGVEGVRVGGARQEGVSLCTSPSDLNAQTEQDVCKTAQNVTGKHDVQMVD